MKAEIHPEYQDVVFMDSSVNPPYRVLTRSTRTSEETIEMDDGKTYPLIRVEISSASHPFYTGKMKLVDTAGMIDRYRQRYGLKDGEEDAEEAAASETPEAATSETPEAGASEKPEATTSEKPEAATSETPEAAASDTPEAAASEETKEGAPKAAVAEAESSDS